MTKNDEFQEVKSSVVSWGKVGDYIQGTLVDIRIREVQDEKKGLVRKNVYEILADEGQYHEIDENRNPVEPPIKCEKNDFYQVWGGREIIDNGMRKIKIGQKVRIVFTEQLEPKKKNYSGFKIIKVYAGPMDEEWLNNQYQEAEPDVNPGF